MRDHSEIWRLRLWVWVPALLFFLANGVAYSIYRLGYAGQVQALESDLGEVQEQLQPQALKRKELERRIQRAKAADDAVKRLYQEKFATRSERLTRVTAEVKELARRAGLSPRAISYPEQGLEDYGLVKRSSAFGVSGTYDELRQFLNLLEHTGSFLTLESISLAESGEEQGPELRMNLRISTLFAQESGPEEEGAARRAAAAAGRPTS
jgi:Tfp pilus assembly protein PilO